MPKSIINYTQERNELVQKLYNILEITETNKMISLTELDENKKKQQSIIELVPEIKKYFLCSRWTYFSCKDRECKRDYLSLIKAIFKDIKIKLIPTVTKKKIDENTTLTNTFYYIV